jgi:uncharacterized protein YcbK (DUF882 family)
VAIHAARTAGLFARPWRVARGAAVASLLVLFGSENLQNAAADGDTRTLAMHHMHTGEDINITYKRNGRYDDAALQKLNHFLRDWRKDEATRMDPHVLDVVWEVYQEVGGKQPIQIVCGYRSPATNAMLRRRSRGVAKFSQHTLGKAIDFYIPGVPLEQLRYAGLRMQRGGVGFYPTSGSPFVHLDTGSVRHWPRMSSDQLARVLATKPRTHYADNHPAAAPNDGGATPVSQRSKRGLIERLFGFGGEGEDEDAAASPAPTPTPAPTRAATKSEPAKPQLAAAVPLPPIKPAAPPAKTARTAQPAPSGYALASASSTPAPGPSPADIVRSRGMWDSAKPSAQPPAKPATAAGDVKAPPPGAAGSGNEQFAWLNGPQGRPAEPAPPAPTPSAGPVEPVRPPAEIPNAEQPEPTGSLTSWPDRAQRPPAEKALAYAAPASREEIARTPPPAPAAASSGRSAPLTRSAAAPVERAADVRPGMRSDNPWLRGLLISPSVHYAMSVAVFGKPDYRQLTVLMQKPGAVLAMTFSADPQPGMTSYSFSGPAVAFLPTVKTRTAALN